MRTITSGIMAVAGILLILGAFNVIDLSNFNPSLAGLGLAALSISASLFMKVWVDKPNSNE